MRILTKVEVRAGDCEDVQAEVVMTWREPRSDSLRVPTITGPSIKVDVVKTVEVEEVHAFATFADAEAAARRWLDAMVASAIA